MVNVTIYGSTMDPMGILITQNHDRSEIRNRASADASESGRGALRGARHGLFLADALQVAGEGTVRRPAVIRGKWGFMEVPGLVNLVNLQKATWKMAIYSEFSHEKW